MRNPRITWLHALLILLQVASIGADQVWRFLNLPKSGIVIAQNVLTTFFFLVLAWLTIRHVWALYIRAGFSFLAVGNNTLFLVGIPKEKPLIGGEISDLTIGLVSNMIIGVLCLVVAKQLGRLATPVAAEPSPPPNPLKGA